MAEGVGIKDEHLITILALMRGGEPMARGVFDIFPKATFIHYYEKTETSHTAHTPLPDLSERVVILVDSVINSGNSIRRVVRELAASRIFVVAGVTQMKASVDLPTEFPSVCFYSLRLSENKYTGKGATDTGNRLFGTTAEAPAPAAPAEAAALL
jgi:uracil phosphoribosyltransferase